MATLIDTPPINTPIGLETSHNRILVWFLKTFPELSQSMKECSHFYDDTHINPYHVEDGIFCHSLMVFKNSQIFCTDNNHVKYSSLFHDLGKPIAREEVPERSRVRFIGHEGISAFMVVDVLNKTDMAIEDKLHIFKIVSLHGTLFNYIRKDGTIKDDIKKTYEGNGQLLKDVVEQVRCDSFGRFFNPEVVEDNDVEFTKNLPAHFETIVNSLGEGMHKGDKPLQLTLLCGAPCSDKSAEISKILETAPDTIIVSRDALVEAVGKKYGLATYSDAWKWLKMKEHEKIEKEEVDAELIRIVQTARREKKPVCIDMTNLSKKSRRKWLNQFEKDYNKKCILFIKGYEQQLKCNALREKQENKRISKWGTINMLKSFSLPLYGEGFDDIEYKWIPERF